ncbi:MAG: DUF4280 domain-containing protein [Alphaproteobacteria bacterium]|nr:DUF4280 domain-containing protein [Alphaproteobacteria bacterium]
MAGDLVVSGALLTCAMGTAPQQATFIPVPNAPSIDGNAVGKVTDIAPGLNIPLFGTCNANPAVPKPCAPSIPSGQWIPGSTKLSIGGVMALDTGCKAICAQGGQISVSFCGQMRSKTS